MKNKFIYFVLSALMLYTFIWLEQVFPAVAKGSCLITSGKWHGSSNYCIRPDCRRRGNCGESAGAYDKCPLLKAGDSLDKAWYLMGKPQAVEENKQIWADKLGDEYAYIWEKQEKIERIQCPYYRNGRMAPDAN